MAPQINSGNPFSGLKNKSATEKNQSTDNAVTGKIQIWDVHCLPGIHKGRNRWEEELLRRKQSILEWQDSNAANRFFKTLLPGGSSLANENAKVMGQTLERYHLTKSNSKHVAELKQNPYNLRHRLELVSSLHTVERQFPLEVYRENLLQILMPIHLGYFSQQYWYLLVDVYTKYLTKLKTIMQRRMQTLKNHVHMDAKGSKNVEFLNMVERNLKVLNMMQSLANSEEARNLEADALYFSDLFNNKDKAKAERQKFADSVTSIKRDPNKLLIDTTSVLNAMRFFPVLHPVAIEQLQILLKRFPKFLMLHIILGRTYRHSLNITIERMKSGEKQLAALVRNDLQKCLEAYGKGKRFIPQQNTRPSRILLKESAQVALQCYNLHHAIKIPREVTAKIVAVGRKNMMELASSEPEDIALQAKLSEALHLV